MSNDPFDGDGLGGAAATEAPPKRRRGPRSKQSTLSQLQRELKQAALALSMLPFMANGKAEVLASPAVTGVLEARADTFANAWVAVAEANPVVKAWLLRLLSGGVWLNAGVQTIAFGYTIAVFSGTLPLHPATLVLMPDMAQFVVREQPTSAPPPAPPSDPSLS